MSNRAERRQMKEVVKKFDLEEKVNSTHKLALASVILCACCLFTSLFTMIMMVMGTERPSLLPTEWTEVVMVNDIGYSVGKDWLVQSVEGSVLYAMSESDTSVLAVSTMDIQKTNANSEIKCTNDNLEEFVQHDLMTAYSSQNITLATYESEMRPMPKVGEDVEYLYIALSQDATTQGTTVRTYTTGVFFIYEDFLYSFAYTSSGTNAVPTDIQKVFDSIRLIPEGEQGSLQPSKDKAQELLDSYHQITSITEKEDTQSADTVTSENAE